MVLALKNLFKLKVSKSGSAIFAKTNTVETATSGSGTAYHSEAPEFTPGY
jgi:hypothetical protein